MTGGGLAGEIMRTRSAVVVAALAAVALFPLDARAVWNQPRFAIGGFLGGGDPNGLRLLNDAGIDLVVPSDYASAVASRRFVARLDSLRAAHPGTFDLQALVFARLDGPGTLFANHDPVTHRLAILRELDPANGLNSPSVAGWNIWDEPPIPHRPGLRPPAGRIYDAIHEMTKLVRDSTTSAATWNKLAFTNLLQISWAAYPWFQQGCGTDTLSAYRCYLDQYLKRFEHDSLPAPVLAIDAYPFEMPEADWRWYFVNLATVRDKAREFSRANYRIPFWSVLQVAPRCANDYSRCEPTPTFNQVRWQAYVSLAYGAKGIFYWTLRPAKGGGRDPSWGRTFLRTDGTAEPALYDSLAALNAELQALGPTLMRLEPEAAFHASANRFKLPAADATLASRLVSGVSGRNSQGMVGCFKSRATGEDYLLVVNKDTRLAQGFRLALTSSADTVYRVGKADGRLLRVAVDAASFDTGVIAPGGGELFRVARRPHP